MFSKSELLLSRSTAIDNQIQAKYWLLADEMLYSSSNFILLFLSLFNSSAACLVARNLQFKARGLDLFRDSHGIASIVQLPPTLSYHKRLNTLLCSVEAHITAEHITIAAGTSKVFLSSIYPNLP